MTRSRFSQKEKVMMQVLKDKVVVITGASGGLGVAA
jgi:FlaA1/EpsC-like NDP-sugar epimerase